VDINIQKTTSIGERTRIQFRAEFFNFFNHANFKLPDRVFVPDFVTGRNVNPNFGQITEAKSPRVIQFGLKIIF
jgi:hypothetical protein